MLGIHNLLLGQSFADSKTPLEYAELYRLVGERIIPGKKPRAAYGTALRFMYRCLRSPTLFRKAAGYPFHAALFNFRSQLDPEKTPKDVEDEIRTYIDSEELPGEHTKEAKDVIELLKTCITIPGNLPAFSIKHPEIEAGTLPEENIIRRPNSKFRNIDMYEFNGNQFAYIGNILGDNWGDSVLLPVDSSINAFTNLNMNCPILIMRLKDKAQKEYIFLSHVFNEDIDGQIHNIITKLKDKKLQPEEIIWSPRNDSEYTNAELELKKFGKGKHVRSIKRSIVTPSCRTLVTSKGWCLYDECENSLLEVQLWKHA